MEEALNTRRAEILSYRGVSICQGEHEVLRDVTLTVAAGEMVYLMGAVGSGKSSLLKTIYGELPVEGARAEVLGHDMRRLRTKHHPMLRRQMGIVFQDFQLLPDRTVRQNLDFVLRATDWRRAQERDARIAEVLHMVRLEDKADAMVYSLSGGQQQCVCIARALLNSPCLIIADEPTGNLDAESGERVMAILDEIRRQHCTAIILSTHNALWPDYFPGTVYDIEGGALRQRVAEGGAPREEQTDNV